MSTKVQNNAIGAFIGVAAAYVANDVPTTSSFFPASPVTRALTMGALGGAAAYLFMGVDTHRQSSAGRVRIAGIGAAAAAVLSYFTPNLVAAGVPGFAGLGRYVQRFGRVAPTAFRSPCGPGYSLQWAPSPTSWQGQMTCQPNPGLITAPLVPGGFAPLSR